jgi:phage terminase small subunit
VLNRLKEIDSLDVLDIVNDDLSGFKLLSEWPKEWRTSISSLDMKKMVTSVGENEELETIIEKIKWPDKVKNLEMIGRHVKIKAWDKEAQAVTVSNNIMPVPTADSIDSWEEQAQLQQDKVLGK